MQTWKSSKQRPNNINQNQRNALSNHKLNNNIIVKGGDIVILDKTDYRGSQLATRGH